MGCFYFSHDLEQSGGTVNGAHGLCGCGVWLQRTFVEMWLTALQGARQVNLKASPLRLYSM